MPRRFSELSPLDAASARLARVNRALDAWDAWDQAQAMPADLRPVVREPGPLGRYALKSLSASIMGVIAQLEADEPPEPKRLPLWERRN